MWCSFTKACLWSLLYCSVHSATVYYNLTVGTINAAPDSYTRKVITANGEFPPPVIKANKGDKLVVRVENKLDYGFSLHLHGLFFPGTPWLDGFPGVTQCPIPPGNSMTYEVDLKDQAGTSWYHSHYNSEYVDGFAAPLIIHDPDDPHKQLYDEEYVVFMQDWYHGTTKILTKELLKAGGAGEEPIPDSGLINGRGRCGVPSNKCDANNKLSDFKFTPGKRYRLRLINGSAFTAFQFSIDGHKLTVIEADLTPVQPYEVDRININVAMRYSVIVKADQPADIYWMKAIMSKACYPEGSGPNLNPYVLATVTYDGAANKKLPPSPSPKKSAETPEGCLDLDPSKLKPVKSLEAFLPKTSNDSMVLTKDATFPLVVSFGPDSKGITRGMFNQKTLNLKPGDPFNLKPKDKRYLTDSNVLELPSSDVIQFFIVNTDAGEHPFHLHGHDFQIIHYNTEANEWKEGEKELEAQVQEKLKFAMDNQIKDNPLRRDTFSVPPGGFVLIRFVKNNPGFWAFHCHIDWHLVQGLGLIFNELPEKQPAIPAYINDTCKAYSLTGAAGRDGLNGPVLIITSVVAILMLLLS